MENWDKVRETIKKIKRDTPTWNSHREHLLSIINTAEAWGLDPAYAEQATISKLTEIVREARIAVGQYKKDRLRALFEWAGTLTVKDLKIKLRGDYREVIYYKITDDPIMPKYILDLYPEQFERIKHFTSMSMQFKEDKTID